MKLHPFYDCVKNTAELIDRGIDIQQQFICAHCGVKQTMDTPNRMFTSGKCEECGKLTDIVKDGCNYMAVIGVSAKRQRAP